MNSSSKAVFVSYASQDAVAARKISEALRTAGVEVWIDQSELRGGDAWDAKIRRQIKACALFMPVISVNTTTRLEGYFRREWNLAVERMHDMDENLPFLVPVAIDDAMDAAARVPERFRERQWMRLPGGAAAEEFGEQIKALLDGGDELDLVRPRSVRGAASVPSSGKSRASRTWLVPAIVGVAATAALAIWQPWRLDEKSRPAASTAASVSPARELAQRALELTTTGQVTRESLDSADQLINQAKQLDPTDAEIWAYGSVIDTWFVFYGFDPSATRKEQAVNGAGRALALNAKSYEARLAKAFVLIVVIAQPASRAEAETMLRQLFRENADEPRTLEMLANLLRDDGRVDEAAALFERAKSYNAAGWAYVLARRFDEASVMIEKALAEERSVANLTLKAIIESAGREDLDAAQATFNELPPSALLQEQQAAAVASNRLFRREPDQALDILRTLPRDWLATGAFYGPKAYLMGIAHQVANRTQAAQAEWRTALDLVERRIAAGDNSAPMLRWKAQLLANLDQRVEAEGVLNLEQQLSGRKITDLDPLTAGASLVLGRREEVLTWLEQQLRNPDGNSWWRHYHARFHPQFDSLRGDPRFEALLRETLPTGAKPMPPLKPTTNEDTEPRR